MLIAELVKLGVETPATAWEGDPSERKPVARLSVETLADMRTRVATLKASKGVAPALHPARTDVSTGTVTLSALDRQLIKERGIPEAEFLATKRAMLARSTVNHKLISEVSQ
jgi:hypothetical protein